MDRSTILSHTHLFKDISVQHRAAIAEICLDKKLEKREILFHEGDRGTAIYILVDGNVQLYKTTPDGREIVIKTVQPGEIFGEVILFEEEKYPVSAVSLKKSTVFMMPKMQFSCLLDNPSFRDEFMGSMMRKMRYLTQQIQYITLHDVEERLLRFLANHYGMNTTLKVALSKKDVAAAINTTPETLSRILMRLKESDRLIWEGKSITISPDVWNEMAS